MEKNGLGFSESVFIHSKELVKNENLFIVDIFSEIVIQNEIPYIVFQKKPDFVDEKPMLIERKEESDNKVKKQNNDEEKKKKNDEEKGISNDPFLPYEECLEIHSGHLEDHVVLHNKYQVFTHHLLLITRRFEPQTDHLNSGDFKAVFKLCRTLLKEEMDDWVFFYNRGENSGCSQPHKHVQFLKVTDMNGKKRLPNHDNLKVDGGVSSNINWKAKYHKFDSLGQMERDLEKVYFSALKDLQIDNFLEEDSKKVMSFRSGGKVYEIDLNVNSYNVIFCRYYFLLVPRRHENCQRVAFCNALSFLHSFYFKFEEQKRKVVEEISFKKVLEHITYPL